jgi:hypothetical protein
MNLFYRFVITILVLCALAFGIMIYMKELLAIPHKSALLGVVIVISVAMYMAYLLLPAWRQSDYQVPA